MAQGNLVAAATSGDRPVARQQRADASPADVTPIAPALGGAKQDATGSGHSQLADLCAVGSPNVGRLPMLDAVLVWLPQALMERFKSVWKLEVAVVLAPVVVDRYETFVGKTPGEALTGVFLAEGAASHGMIVLEPGLVFQLLDGLLGARQTGRSRVERTGGFTLIETGLMQLVASQVLGSFAAALEQVAPVAFTFQNWEADKQRIRPAVEGEQVLGLDLGISFRGETGSLTIMLPVSMLDPMRSQFEAVFPGEKLGHDGLWSAHLAHEIARAPLEISAVLYEAMVPLGQIRNLAPGDTLSFDLPPDAGVDLFCGREHLAKGRMGKAGARIAVQMDTIFATPGRGGAE